MIDNIKKHVGRFGNAVANVNPNLFLYIAVLLVVIVYFWNRILQIFKPLQTAENEAKQVTNQNKVYLSNKSITNDGYFINGLGGVTKYRITSAKQNAEDLAALLNTYRGAKWYSTTLSFFGLGSITRIKYILNPNYPASYRRYVQEIYRTVYTDNRSLQTDVRKNLTGFAGSSAWNENLTKYFIN
ncbi:hypothetical protein [Pedobacter nototheniae]|uniref:hypothetical protein n=1 Tax=Pedobacter nototheniae TaxID=2488994 RepID=UPI00103C2D34|nr:hypothetical protein [Pedobacter nototheniae]